MTTSTPERQEGIQLLQKAIARIEETIKGLGGSFNVQMAVSILEYIHFMLSTRENLNHLGIFLAKGGYCP